MTMCLRPSVVDLLNFKMELKVMMTTNHQLLMTTLMMMVSLLMMVITRPLDLWDCQKNHLRPLDFWDNMMDFPRPLDLWDLLMLHQLQWLMNFLYFQRCPSTTTMKWSPQQKFFLQHQQLAKSWTLQPLRDFKFHNKRLLSNDEHEWTAKKLCLLDPAGHNFKALMELLHMIVQYVAMMMLRIWLSMWRTWNKSHCLVTGASSLRLATLSCVKVPEYVISGS